MEELFQQKTFGWQELAILYAPGLTPFSLEKTYTLGNNKQRIVRSSDSFRMD